MNGHESMLNDVINLNFGRWFPAQFAGTCCLSGTQFHPGERISKLGEHGYVSSKGMEIACVTGGHNLESALRRSRPFDTSLMLEWLEEARQAGERAIERGQVYVWSKNRSFSTYRKLDDGSFVNVATGRKVSEKQLASRTKSAVYMTRNILW